MSRLATRTIPPARSPAACDTPACATSAASISPGLDPEPPRNFTCASARPKNSSTPSPPPRQVTCPVHPRAGRTIRVGNKPLRRQRRRFR